jgi:hypothetical protein
MSALNDKALLVQLSISQWTARKLDKKATKKVLDDNHASNNAGRFNKLLLPANELLDRVHRKSTFIRTFYYRQTLPWGIEGTQLLPTTNYLDFVSEYRQHRSEWEALVSDFTANYEGLQEAAERMLGDLYDPNDYPSVGAIRDKFRIDLAVFPVPATDFRVAISSSELTRIQEDIEQRVQNAASLAMKDVWQRLFDRVEHIAGKLSDHRAIFRDSMIEGARADCELLSRLNFTDDPNLEAMRQEVERKLARNHPDSLRNDPILRREKAEEANDIMDRMKVFMGGL